MLDEFLINSLCAKKYKQKRFLLKLLNLKELVTTTLLYRASVDGWSCEDFHKRCDEKGPTICLFQIENGDCVGGHTTAKWTSDDYPGKFTEDKYSMLFNLSCYRHFPNTSYPGTSIVCHHGYGPYFSGGFYSELCAWKEPFDGKGHCSSFVNTGGYAIQFDEDKKNMLTNQEDGAFTITELEVWEVNIIK